MGNIFIIGIEKCGTTSLETELKSKGHNVKRWEWSYCFPGIRDFIDFHYPGYEKAIITRDPIQRCYSDYNYQKKMKYIPDISYEDALVKFPQFAQGSVYEKWIMPDDLIFRMEDLEVYSNVKVGNYSKMTDKQIELTKQAIERAKNQKYSRRYDSVNWKALGLDI